MISQSNYIPWKGFFDSINAVDHYVAYDAMQYTKRDWRNRNKIKTPQGPVWLSIPVNVSGKYTQKISEVTVTDTSWCQSHWDIIRQNYKTAPYFKTYEASFKDLYQRCESLQRLTDINFLFLEQICQILNISTKLSVLNDLDQPTERNEKLIHVCKLHQADQYLTGPAAKNYLDENQFRLNNIEVKYFNYGVYSEYPQLYPPFTHEVSILDTLFMLGPETGTAIFKNSAGKV